ncbi:MAG: RodZ domain-containing protein [Pseudomonadota bacterium]
MSEAPENPEPEVPPQVGAVLAAVRCKQGMSVADVAHQMKLSVSQVEALEADDFDRLPGNIFVRGFVRNYARLLGLDPDPLLAAVGRIYAAAPSVHKSPTLKMIPFPSQGMTSWQKYAVAGGVVAVALLVYQSLRDESVQAPPQPTPVPPSTAAAEVSAAVSAEPVPVSVAPALQPPATQAPTVAASSTSHEAAQPMKQPEQAATVPEGKQPEPPAKPVAATPQSAKPPEKAKMEKIVVEKAVAETVAAETKPETVPVVVPGTVPVEPAKNESTVVAEAAQKTAGGGKRGSVQLHFEQDTWVVVKAEDGKVIYSRNHVPAGTYQSVRVTTPFSVIIGNAAGSKVQFNHRPIDLAPYTKDGVVRLTISE